MDQWFIRNTNIFLKRGLVWFVFLFLVQIKQLRFYFSNGMVILIQGLNINDCCSTPLMTADFFSLYINDILQHNLIQFFNIRKKNVKLKIIILLDYHSIHIFLQ